MNRILFLILILILNFNFYFSQTPELEIGSMRKLEKKKLPQKIIGSDENYFYTVSWENVNEKHPNLIRLERYNVEELNLDTIWEFEMPKVMDIKPKFENIFYLNGNLLLFTSAKDTEIQKNVLYLQKISPSGEAQGSFKSVGELSLYNDKKDGFNFKLTEDKSKIVVFFYDTYEDKYDKEPYTVKIIDGDMKEVFGRALKFPLQDRRFKVNDYKVSEKGNIYFSISAEKISKRRKTKRPSRNVKKEKFDQIFLSYNAESFKFNSFLIDDTKFKPENLSFGIDTEDNVHIFAFATKKSGSKFAGVFYIKISNETEKIEKKIFKNFSKDKKFLESFENERNGENENQWFSYGIGDVNFLQDGTIIFLAENKFTNVKIITGKSSKSVKNINYNFCNDLLSVHVNEENDIDWVVKIPKNQYSSNDNFYYSSYFVTNKDNKLRIIFNDHPKNLNVKNPNKIKAIKKNSIYKPFSASAVILTLFSDGSYEKYELFTKKLKNFSTSPRLIFQKEDLFFIYAQQKKKYAFSSFELD